MSPKRKKVEAALKNLFSTPPPSRSKPEDTDEMVTQPEESTTQMVKKPSAKLRRKQAAGGKPGAAQPIERSPSSGNQQARAVREPFVHEALTEVTVQNLHAALPKTVAVENKLPETEIARDQALEPAPKKEHKHVAAETQLVIFKLADEYYAVEIALVESIIRMQPYTIVPHVPRYIVGVTNLRGYVLPIVDLRTRFGLPSQEETATTRIMVLLINGEKMGMIVDEVNEVAQVLSDDIDPTPALIVNINMEFVDGIAKLRDEHREFVRMAILLNMEKALKVK